MHRTLVRYRRALGFAIAVGLAAAVTGCWRQSGPRQRVVLITLDTLRYDSLAGRAEHPSTMPLTDAWAQKGLVFQQYYSATSSTQPSHATIFTGLHPWQHGVTRNGQVLAAKFVTLAERLKQAGFATAAVVASVTLHSRFGFAQGFDVFEQHFTHGVGATWEGVPVDTDHFYALADTVTDAAVNLLDHTTGERQFFWFHYFDPHEPYGDSTTTAAIPLGALFDKAAQGVAVYEDLHRARELYDADVGFLDRSLNRLLQRLHQDGATYETHIVVVSDHGESFGEDGAMGHGKRLNDEQIHVPLVIESPRVAPSIRTDPAGSIDLMPTILSLAGLSDPAPTGRNLCGPPDTDRWVVGMRRSFVETTQEQYADGSTHALDPKLFYVATGDVIYTGNSSGLLGPPARVTGLDPGLSAQLIGLFRSFESDLSGLTVEEALDPTTQNALRALGYTR